MQTELEDNEKLMAEFTEQLKKLEDEAGEIMKACQEAEVSLRLAVFVPEKYLVFVVSISEVWCFIWTCVHNLASKQMNLSKFQTLMQSHLNKLRNICFSFIPGCPS